MISSALIAAMIAIECPSGDARQIVHDHGELSYGILCMRSQALIDVNHHYATSLKMHDLLDRTTAIQACIAYLSIYCTRRRLGHEPTDEDYARTWVGGPGGPWRGSSLAYWRLVQKHLTTAGAPTGSEQPSRDRGAIGAQCAEQSCPVGDHIPAVATSL